MSAKNKNVDIKNYVIYWKMRNWKSMLATCIATEFDVIYANYEIKHKNKNISILIQKTRDLARIKYTAQKAVLVFDEAWINFNSKDSRSKNSRFLQNLLMLCWKLNLNIIWIGQRWKSIDVNVRDLCTDIYQVRKINRRNYPIFMIDIKKRGKHIDEVLTNRTIRADLIMWLKEDNITYDTFAISQLDKIEKEKK